MERLTERFKDGPIVSNAETCFETTERLATIEDILGPSYDISRLKELVEADREGRVVVLPCKVGDTAYRMFGLKNGSKYTVPATVAGIHIVRPENRRYQSDEPHLVLKVNGGFAAHVSLSRIGKDVFLTRETAEKALEAINGKK